GRYQPRAVNERIAMYGALEFMELHAKGAVLWSEAIAADSTLGLRGRYQAVIAAAQAGCGVGKDGDTLTEAERARWRAQAREWFRDELAAATKEVTTEADRVDHSFALQVLRT